MEKKKFLKDIRATICKILRSTFTEKIAVVIKENVSQFILSLGEEWFALKKNRIWKIRKNFSIYTLKKYNNYYQKLSCNKDKLSEDFILSEKLKFRKIQVVDSVKLHKLYLKLINKILKINKYLFQVILKKDVENRFRVGVCFEYLEKIVKSYYLKYFCKFIIFWKVSRKELMYS